MIKRIKVKGYKSLVDLEINLQPFSLLFGPNSSGKSNFLDALQLLSRVVTSRTLKEAFDPPYRGTPLESFTFEPEGIKGLRAKESAIFSMEVDVELSNVIINKVNQQIKEMKSSKDSSKVKDISYIREKFLRYKIEIEIFPNSGILRVSDECLQAIKKNGEPKARRPFIEKIEKRIHLRMEGQSHPIYYDLHLDRSILSLPLYPPHYPHITAMQHELFNWNFFYFEPRERMRSPNPVKEVHRIGPMGEDLTSFLNTLKVLEPDQFKSIEKSLKMIVPFVTGIKVGVNDMGEVELKLIENKTPIPSRVLSEGTLRVLGLLSLWGIKEPPAVVGFEEPENGVHPRRLKLIAELLDNRSQTGNTQLIVTTHSPLFLDMVSNDNLYLCRKIKGRTIIEPFDDWGPLFRKTRIEKAINVEEVSLSVGERILRGDFDA